jgi:hypothetical protein
MNIGHYILKDGKVEPIDVSTDEGLMEWGRWFEKADRHIGCDEIDGIKISTVFLGLDHGWGGGRPVLFETMVFGGKHDQHMQRYYTLTQAQAGHDQVVAMVKNDLPATKE